MNAVRLFSIVASGICVLNYTWYVAHWQMSFSSLPGRKTERSVSGPLIMIFSRCVQSISSRFTNKHNLSFIIESWTYTRSDTQSWSFASFENLSLYHFIS